MQPQSTSPNTSDDYPTSGPLVQGDDPAEDLLQLCLADDQIAGLIGVVSQVAGVPREDVTAEVIIETLAKYAEA